MEQHMGTEERDKLMSFLFDRDGCELVNIKFFRGPKKSTSEEIFGQAHRALEEALKAPNHVVPVSGRTRMSRAELVRAD
jgi:hypothetical protein